MVKVIVYVGPFYAASVFVRLYVYNRWKPDIFFPNTHSKVDVY